jgi:hypothetical protein
MSQIYRTATTTLLATAFALSCAAQTSIQQEKIAAEQRQSIERQFIKAESGENPQGAEAKAKAEMMELLESRSRVVQGKPYAAESQTDVVQTLADGNRIVRHTSSKFFRDSSGRTRREQTFGAINPSIPGETKIFIDDPVANVAWVIDPGSHSARKLVRTGKYMVERNAQMMAETEPVGLAKLPKLDEGRDIVREQLGQKMIEGVLCSGTRDTITIPSGQIGNERPVVIVTETWTSPAIGALVQSSTTDPRFGQTTYQLLNLQLGEQQIALFEPPASYQIESK